MEKPEAEQEETNWSEAVEDLVEAGNTEAAISLLESTISKLEKIQQSQPTKESLNLQLASALTNLANLYSSNGFSLKSDHLLSRAFQIRYIHIKIHAPFSFFFPPNIFMLLFFHLGPWFFLYSIFSDAAANIAKKDSKDASKDTARNSSSTDGNFIPILFYFK